jgi:hypothetical protein
VNPLTGAQTAVSSGGFFATPVGITTGPGGKILLADANAFGGPGGVIRIDPNTGAQTTISTGFPMVEPRNLALGKKGEIFLSVQQVSIAGMMSEPGIIRVDTATGVQTIITEGDFFHNIGIYGIAVESDGEILASNGVGIIRVNPETGNQTILTFNGDTGFAGDIAIVPIPEPSTLVLFGIGAGTLLVYRAARKRRNLRLRS